MRRILRLFLLLARKYEEIFGKYEEILGKYEEIFGKYEEIFGKYEEIFRKYEEICSYGKEIGPGRAKESSYIHFSPYEGPGTRRDSKLSPHI